MKQVRACIEQGINTYKVEVVQLKQKNADWELQNIWSKVECGDKLTKVGLVAVALKHSNVGIGKAHLKQIALRLTGVIILTTNIFSLKV